MKLGRSTQVELRTATQEPPIPPVLLQQSPFYERCVCCCSSGSCHAKGLCTNYFRFRRERHRARCEARGRACIRSDTRPSNDARNNNSRKPQNSPHVTNTKGHPAQEMENSKPGFVTQTAKSSEKGHLTGSTAYSDANRTGIPIQFGQRSESYSDSVSASSN